MPQPTHKAKWHIGKKLFYGRVLSNKKMLGSSTPNNTQQWQQKMKNCLWFLTTAAA